jgi:hypothetical protein
MEFQLFKAENSAGNPVFFIKYALEFQTILNKFYLPSIGGGAFIIWNSPILDLPNIIMTR